MKTKLSVSIDGKFIAIIEKLISSGRFRNKSHVLEYSLKKYLEDADE